MGYSTTSIGAWNTWVPTHTGYSANPTAEVARYCLIGKMCTVEYNSTAGTSNATSTTMTLPFASNQAVVFSTGIAVDSGAGATTTLRMDLTAGSNIATLYKSPAATVWTATGNKGVKFQFTYEIQ